MQASLITPNAPRMAPVLTRASRPFWTGGAEGKLRLLHDKKRNVWISPYDDVPDDADIAPADLSGKGEVFSFTVNYQQYHPEVTPPYVVALVEIDEQPGLRLPTNIVNCNFDDLHIGMRVKVAFEPLGDLFAPVFEPDVQ